MGTEIKPRSGMSARGWLVLGVLALALLVVLTGGGVITTESGCQDRVNTDPGYANGANFIGLGIGFCIAE
jgi:hypothetical protein